MASASQKVKSSSVASRNIVLAPMVRGSELAFRQMVRHQHHAMRETVVSSSQFVLQEKDEGEHIEQNEELPMICYTPMLRASEIIRAFAWWKEQQQQQQQHEQQPHHHHHLDHRDDQYNQASLPLNTPEVRERALQQLHEDGVLFLYDACANLDDGPTVLQLCGSHPEQVYEAAMAIFHYNHYNYNEHNNVAPCTTEPLLPLLCTDDHGQHSNCRRWLYGIDFNLGCPQSCAQQGEFGAFLAEQHPLRAIACVRALVQARQDYYQKAFECDTNTDPLGKKLPHTLISAKIRLGITLDSTLSLAKSLQRAGCDVLAVHCRQRHAKFDGTADFDMGRQIVEALDIPVYLNGADLLFSDPSDNNNSSNSSSNNNVLPRAKIEQILVQTGAAKLMVARDFLSRPDLWSMLSLSLSSSSLSSTCPALDLPHQPTQKAEDAHTAYLAATYLAWATRYVPPTHEYIQTHIKWIFRRPLAPSSENQADYKHNWRHCLWNFLRRPYLKHLCQYRAIVVLFCDRATCPIPRALLGDSVVTDPVPTFSVIRHMGKQ